MYLYIPYQSRLYNNMRPIGTTKFDYSSIKEIKNFSKHASFGFRNKSLDFVYIDGDHNYNAVVEDIEHWQPKIKSGGYIAGHDIIIYDVLYAVQKTLNTPNMVLFSDTSWLIKV